MAKFRQVHTTFWTDPRVMEEMTAEDKYFYLYLLTNPNTTQIGIYQITKKAMAFDMGYSPESVNSLIDRFTNHHKLLKYNPDTREIALLNWGKYNFNRAGKPVIDCIRSELKEVKDQSLISLVMEKISNDSVKEEFLRYVDDTSTISGQEEEEEEEKEREEEQQQQQEEKPHAADFYQKNYGVLNPFIGEKIQKWSDDLNNDLVVEAMERALEKGKKFSYAEAILKNWADANIRTMEAVHASDMEFKNRHSSNRKSLFEQGEESKKRQNQPFKKLAKDNDDDLPY